MFLYANVSILIKKNLQACNFIVKMTLVQVFCYEFCQIFENTYFTEKRLVPVFMLKQCVCSFSIYITATLMEKLENFIATIWHEVSSQFEIFVYYISHLRHYYIVCYLSSYRLVNKGKKGSLNNADDVEYRLC